MIINVGIYNMINSDLPDDFLGFSKKYTSFSK